MSIFLASSCHAASIQRKLIQFSRFYVVFGFLFLTVSALGQNIITVPFNNGFVGLNTANNAADQCYYLSGAGGLGWTNVQFTQNSPTNIFVAQGNDIIGSVLITASNGVEYSIPGFIKWRTPSGNNPATMVFSPSAGSTYTLATNGFNGSSTYTITDLTYIGLTFNGETLTISPVPGVVTGNAATNGLLDALNNYLQSFADMSISDAIVSESGGSVTITVSISTPVSSVVTVNYTISNGTATAGLDYTSVSGTLTFPINSLSQTFTISILEDLLPEANENFTITLTDPVNVSILDAIGNVTITDNEVISEVCNGLDDNGNGQIDEGVLNTYYADTDGDGYGNPSSTIEACSAPSGYVINNTDCNDVSAAISPSTVWYLDADNDGYYINTSVSCTSPGANYNTTGGTSGDCDDNNAAVNAASTEVCNGIDDNCNGQIDEGVLNTYYADVDGDGYGDAGSSVQACSAPTGYVTNNTDCNDASASINPTTVWYLDADGDGYYVSTSVSCTSPGANYNTIGGINGDCNDSNSAINAAAIEICGNGIDEDCDGSDLACVIPGCTDASACNYNALATVTDGSCTYASTWYLDADGDGYYVSTSVSCTSPGSNYNTTGGTSGDCDDNNAAVNAAATEVCNGIDDNCNGQIDELSTLDCDNDGLTLEEETNNGTDPLNPDTDGDGVTDTNEIADGTNPNDPCSLIIASQTVAPSAAWLALDCDGDGTPNEDETGTDPLNPDTDGDGVTDTNEIADGTNPNDPCSLIIASQTVA
ncbi:MAG: hypothetical protein RLZZ71_170, partial [Bacteroidota bacterium]